MNRFSKALLTVFVFVLAAGLWLWFSAPDPAPLQSTDPKMTRFMERVCQASPPGCRIVWTPLRDMAPFIPQAVVLAEDMRFYEHSGFDKANLVAAFKTNWESGKFIWGGSTITQQLAKNLYFGPEKSIFRKLKEALATYKMERDLPKTRILEIYLNVVQWGPALFGIGNASQAYFQKKPSELTPLEASYLASILPNPEHAQEPEWKTRFATAGGRVFDVLLDGYLNYLAESKTVANCQIPMDASEKRALDFAIARIFNQYWAFFLKEATPLTMDALTQGLKPDEWAAVQGQLRPADKVSGNAAFMKLVRVRQNGYCLD